MLLSESQLFGARARQERRRRRTAASDPEAILRDLQSLNPGAPVVHETYGVGRYVGLQPMDIAGQRERVPGARVPGRRSRLRAGARAAPGEPLHRRRAGGSAAAQARHRSVGARAPARRRADPRRGRRAARPVRTAQGAAGLAAAGARARLPDLRQRLPVRGDRRSGRGDPPGARRTCAPSGRWIASSAATSASARPRWRCAPPSSRSRPASRWRCSPRRRCWCSSTCQLSRPLRRLAGAHRGAVALRLRGRDPAVLAGLEHGKVDIVIATHRLLHAHARFKDLGLLIVDEEHRFGVRDKERLQALRAERARADAHRHADSAHAQHGARRPARPVADHDAAGGARLAIKTFRHRMARADAARGGAARAAPRRPDLLRAQRGAQHREDRRRAAGAWCRRPTCASATARCASATSSS